MVEEIERARSALQSLSPDCDRKTWVKIGMAAHAAGLSLQDFMEFSRPGATFNESACKATWRSFKNNPAGGVTAAALFGMARDAGWTDDGTPGKPIAKPPKAVKTPPAPPREPAPGKSAAEVWGRAVPADVSHPYIFKKQAAGVPLSDLRVLPGNDTLRITGKSMSGALVVPARSIDGELKSCVLITPQGEKMNLPGSPISGALHVVGELVSGGIAYVVEGIGQAWACWQATGHPAVVCFGAGNMGKVAAALRQGDESAKLVLVPDANKEGDAAKIAAEVCAAVAAMPEGKPSNYDASDYAQEHGVTELERLLEAATEPPKPQADVHPMARFIDATGEVTPPNWLIPGFLADGVTVLAGTHGVGKSTALVPLVLTVAGIAGHTGLMPRQWRHVVFCTEDASQVKRILAGLIQHGGLGINAETVRERFHLVEASRLNPAFVAKVAPTYRAMFSRTVEGVEVHPLTVFDTKSACFAAEDENSNSESSQLMATLKQNFEAMPVWLVTHVAKASRNDTAGLTARGASALEADANCTAFLTAEGDKRYLTLGKRRFEPRWPELVFESHVATVPTKDAWGNVEMVALRWATASPPEMSRQDAQQEAREEAQRDEANACRGEVLDVVSIAWDAGQPVNRNAAKAKVHRQATQVIGCIESLLSESWLIEITVPSKERTNNRRSAFLVALTAPEREEFLASGNLPPKKLEIPQSWRKPANPFVPAPESEMPAPDGASDESSPEKA